MSNRVERFVFVVAMIWCIQCWLPMAPLGIAPWGDVFGFAALYAVTRTLVRHW